MSLSIILLTILSGICLLLWGLRTIKRAVLRGYGTQVQAGVAIGTKNRFMAFLSGAIVTFFMQSSVATVLLASSLFGRGLMTLAAGLAIVIGADVGSSILAQVLSFDMRWLAPLCLSVGIIFHLMYDDGDHKRFAARIIMGLGFVLSGLAVIREATAPLSQSETLPLILAPLSSEPFIALLISAALTYFMHSGLSAVLLFASLAHGGVLPLDLAITFVVGANVGISIIPMTAVLKDVPQAAQIPLGNIIMRMIVGIIVLIGLPYIIEELSLIDWSVSQKVIATHIGFNMLLGIIFLPFVGTLASVCKKFSPAKESESDLELKPRYLDKKALSTPSIALSCATRETLHMAEILEDMLTKTYPALAENSQENIDDICAKDDVLDNIFRATKDYIIRLNREELSDHEADQSMRIMNFATNIEHAGDVIEKSLMEMAAKKTKRNDQFSEEGLAEIKSFHKNVKKNLQLAQNIFLSSNPDLAKQLLDYKKGLKIAESKTSANHMKRLQERLPETMATSGIHMDVIRDLRRINTYVTSVVYDVLED
jgi:phosphate:Na+ symporter